MLDRVTITGADDNTDPLWMLDLALAYPWLEFGILVSQSREGSPRYPSRKWQEQLLKSAHRMNLSMHVCGKWARGIFSSGTRWDELPPIKIAAQRIQVNGEPGKSAGLGCISEFNDLGREVIFQYPRAYGYLNECSGLGFDCVPLFDESGGEGRQTRNWSDIPGCDYVGYAGGIGPDDV